MVKLDQFSQDIVDFLKRQEPEMVRWSDIADRLWSKYRCKYKDKKSYGVALTQKLKPLIDNEIKRVDHLYGSPNSIPPKPNLPNKQTMGKWEYKKWEKSYADEQRALELKRLEAEVNAEIEVMDTLSDNDPEYQKKEKEICAKHYRLLGVEQGEK